MFRCCFKENIVLAVFLFSGVISDLWDQRVNGYIYFVVSKI